MASARKATVKKADVQSPVVTKAFPGARATKALPTVAQPIAASPAAAAAPAKVVEKKVADALSLDGLEKMDPRSAGIRLYSVAKIAAQTVLHRDIIKQDFMDMYPAAQKGSGTWEARAKSCGYSTTREAGERFPADLASVPDSERGKGLGCARYKSHQAKLVAEAKKPVSGTTAPAAQAEASK